MHFRPNPKERELEFSLKWSAIGCISALAILSACSYLIPDDPSAPRYNTVMGDRRAPALNPGGNPQQAGLTQANAEQMKPTRTPALNPLPAGSMVNDTSAPNASVTPSRSANGAASATTMTNQAARPAQKGWFSRQWDWVSGKHNNVGETPVPLGVPLPAGSMVMPKKDGTNLAMADREDYPKLDSVPARPADKQDEASPQVRLQNAKRGMEADRDLNERAREVLKREATSEPTLLEEYGTTAPELGEEGALDPLFSAPPEEEAPPTIKVVRGTEISEQVLRGVN